MKTGTNSWVIDTGSGHHLISLAALTAQEKETEREALSQLKLATANGRIVSKNVVDAHVGPFTDTVEARCLPGTPRVLSVYQLVQDGAEFSWSLDVGAILKYRGTVFKLIVQRGVPLLPCAGLAFESGMY